MKLVPILWKVLNNRFDKAMRFYFGWQSYLPILIVTRKQLHNFAHEFCDHSVYETSRAYGREAHAAFESISLDTDKIAISNDIEIEGDGK